MKDIESQLVGLVPRGDRLDRDRLMYLAGQAAAARTSVPEVPEDDLRPTPNTNTTPSRLSRERIWQAATALTTIIAAGLLVMVVWPSEPQVVERVVEVPVPRMADKDFAVQLAERQPDRGMADSRTLANDENRPNAISETPWYGRMALAAVSWFPQPDEAELRSQLPSAKMLDDVLLNGLDFTESPATVVSDDTPTAAVPQRHVPRGYREMLDSLLEAPLPDDANTDGEEDATMGDRGVES